MRRKAFAVIPPTTCRKPSPSKPASLFKPRCSSRRARRSRSIPAPANTWNGRKPFTSEPSTQSPPQRAFLFRRIEFGLESKLFGQRQGRTERFHACSACWVGKRRGGQAHAGEQTTLQIPTLVQSP